MMPARRLLSSRALGSSGTTPSTPSPLASAGMLCATLRKKSSMYWSEAGSYCACRSASDSQLRNGETHVNLDSISFREPAHMPLGKESIGEEREQDKFGECEQFISRQLKPSAPVQTVSQP